MIWCFGRLRFTRSPVSVAVHTSDVYYPGEMHRAPQALTDEDMVEVPENLSEWFTHDEWNQMSFYERKRVLNVFENYCTLTALGINAPKPDFMYTTLHKISRAPTHEIPVSSTNKITERTKEKANTLSGHKSVTYELRQCKSKSYREDSSSDDDDYLFCDECNREWFGDCPSHGPLIHIMDTQVPVYPLDPERAAKTLPSIFRIGPSAIRKAGLGVWTTTSLLPHIVFGPYEGCVTDTANEEGYCWLVREKGRPSGFIDASNSSISNWMRFVNCSRHEKEQNLVAFQYKRKIYYRTTHLILPDVELLVWYGEEFGEVLGIDNKKYHINKQCSGAVFPCSKCKLSFSSAAYRDRHLSYCWRRCMPSKGSRTTAIKLIEEDLGKNNNSSSSTDLRHDTTKNSASKIGNNMNQISYTGSNTSSETLLGKQDIQHKNLAATCTKQPNIWDTKNDLLLSTENDVDNTSLPLDSHFMVSIKCTESTNGCISNVHSNEQTQMGKRPYKCATCNKAFSLASILHNHERIHTGEHSHKCATCNKTFSEASNLRKHQRIHTGEHPYTCTTCNKAFSQSSNLHRHERIHTGEHPYKCTTCNKAFSQASYLHMHERIHTGERPYKCTTCNKAFSQASYLHTHKRIHTGERPYKCATCKNAFSRSSILHSHERIHTGERPYKCTTCSKAFSQTSYLHRHERIHTGERPYKCTTCSKAFSQASYLHRHERIHTGERPYKCTTCSKAFSQASYLHRHERIHTGERPYKCATCNKAFSQASILHSHERIHTGERPYKCGISNKASNLHSHERILTGKHPYECNTCNKAFSLASDLRSHERIHTRERPYKCTTCNKAFSQASVLRSHKRIHTGERPYKCTTCNKAFSQASVLRSHKRIHTGERPYKCTTCNKAFTSATHRDQHLSYCWRRCMPSKGSRSTAIELLEENLGKKNNSSISTDLRHDTTKNSASKIGNNMNQILYTGSNNSSETLLGKQDIQHKNLAATCTKQPNIWDTKNDLLLSTANDVDNTSLPLDSHFMVSIKCTESTNGCISNIHSNEQTQMGKRPYKCATCNKAFSLASILHNHERIHTGERSHKCATCNKAFSEASNLRKHQRIHTGEHPYTCTTCNKAFSQSSNLHRHERIHTGEHPYKCTTCNKAFSQASYLHMHERIHTGERPYKCTTCNKAFSQASYLHTHKRIHTGERPYKCATCNNAFSRSSILHSHERIHTGERPYKCTTCSKAFSQASYLHRHERIHTGERPYKCTTCSKAFSQASYLHRHERIHTGERPYKCITCNKAFSQASVLRSHKQIHTRECSSKPSTCKKPFL